MKQSLVFLFVSLLAISLINAKTIDVKTDQGPEYAYVYNLSGNKEKAIKRGESVTFDSNGPMTSGITHKLGSSDIVLVNEGTYLINFYVSCTNQNSFMLFLNNTEVQGSGYGGFSQYTFNTAGQAIVKATAGAVLTLRYESKLSLESSYPPFYIYAAAGAVNASVIIQKIDQ